jgi:prevent-host-death family protein
MKKKTKTKALPEAVPGKEWVLHEAAVAYGKRTEVSVREAKDGLSGLLERAANGEEIVVTSDGQPKAMIVRYRIRVTGKPFKPDREWIRSMPMTQDSTEMLRKMRDEGF